MNHKAPLAIAFSLSSPLSLSTAQPSTFFFLYLSTALFIDPLATALSILARDPKLWPTSHSNMKLQSKPLIVAHMLPILDPTLPLSDLMPLPPKEPDLTPSSPKEPPTTSVVIQLSLSSVSLHHLLLLRLPPPPSPPSPSSASPTSSSQLKPEEISASVKDFDELGSLAPIGLFLAGAKYMVIQGEPEAVICGKKVVELLDGTMHSNLKKDGLNYFCFCCSLIQFKRLVFSLLHVFMQVVLHF